MTEQQELFEDGSPEEMDWKAYKDGLRNERERRKDAGQLLLAEEGIDFISKNEGVHLIIVDYGVTYDFWPSTGKWTRRERNQKFFRGAKNLVDTIKKARPKHD